MFVKASASEDAPKAPKIVIIIIIIIIISISIIIIFIVINIIIIKMLNLELYQKHYSVKEYSIRVFIKKYYSSLVLIYFQTIKTLGLG